MTTYAPETEGRIIRLQEALHQAGSMLVIEEALRRATDPGPRWPQNGHGGDFPNSAFALIAARLIVRSPVQARWALMRAGWNDDPG